MKIHSSYVPKTLPTKVPRTHHSPTPSEHLNTTQNAAPLSEVPFDSAKVEQIKNAIAQGCFQIHPEAIADGIIQMAKDLISSHV